MIKPIIFTFFILAFIVTISSTNLIIKNNINSKTDYAMGTSITITIAEKNIDNNIFKEAFSEFKRVEKIFKNSPDLNNREVNKLFNIALDLQRKTNGAFSPYLSDVIALWQFDKTNKTITQAPTQAQIELALKSKKINLYAIAKGYGIDQVASVLKKHNINNFIINAGGDIYVAGSKYNKPWQIGIKNTKQVLSCDNNSHYAIATSSNLYNSYKFNDKEYGHLINGNTGWPVEANKSISIIANNATMADGYATAVFVAEDTLIKTLKTQGIYTIKQEKDNFVIFNLPKNCKVKKITL